MKQQHGEISGIRVARRTVIFPGGPLSLFYLFSFTQIHLVLLLLSVAFLSSCLTGSQTWENLAERVAAFVTPCYALKKKKNWVNIVTLEMRYWKIYIWKMSMLKIWAAKLSLYITESKRGTHTCQWLCVYRGLVPFILGTTEQEFKYWKLREGEWKQGSRVTTQGSSLMYTILTE